MRLLLDTHAFLWWDSSDRRLPEALQSAIASPGNQVFVSAATVWEIAIKRASGKLTYGRPIGKAIEEQGFSPLPITVEQAEWAGGASAIASRPF
jgi:PIN domain nuclease of toxin-antitoxin system